MLDSALKDRISFIGHDMNDPQPVKGAAIYMFRSVLLNWPKKYCVKFVKNLIPALEPGSKVLINEGCLPEPGTLSTWDDKILRSVIPLRKPLSLFPGGRGGETGMIEDELLYANSPYRSLDLCMMGMFNSNERTVEEWKEIFTLADERFKFLGARRPVEGSLLWIIEAVWEG